MQPTEQQSNQTPQWSYAPEQSNQQPLSQDATTDQDSSLTMQEVEESIQNEGSIIISWTASEFIAFEKSSSWFIKALGVNLVIVVLVFLITSRDIISTVSVFILGLFFMVLAKRQPRVLDYAVTNKGIDIGGKLYSYNILKSFSVIEEGAISSIDILPLKRYMPSLSIYYEPQDEPKIVEALSAYLPQDNRKQPLVDKLMHKIRF